MPSSPPSKTFAVLNVANGSSSNTPDSITLIRPTFSVTNILSSAKSIAQGFYKLVAKTCTNSLPSLVIGSGIGGGLEGEIHITIAKIIAADLPAILTRLSITKSLQILIIITSFIKAYITYKEFLFSGVGKSGHPVGLITRKSVVQIYSPL